MQRTFANADVTVDSNNSHNYLVEMTNVNKELRESCKRKHACIDYFNKMQDQKEKEIEKKRYQLYNQIKLLSEEDALLAKEQRKNERLRNTMEELIQTPLRQETLDDYVERQIKKNRRPNNPFVLFKWDTIQAFREKHSDLSDGEITKLMSTQWYAMRRDGTANAYEEKFRCIEGRLAEECNIHYLTF